MSTVLELLWVTKSANSDFFGVFPKHPDVSVTGESMRILALRAREALLAELNRLQQADQDWPAEGGLDLEPYGSNAGQYLLIEVSVDDRPVRLNISMGERLLKRLDAAAEVQDISRSGYIAAAVRERLGAEAKGRSGISPGGSLQAELGRIGGRLGEVIGPDSDLARRVTELDQHALEGLRALASLLGYGQAKK
jgi:hypothetical protein